MDKDMKKMDATHQKHKLFLNRRRWRKMNQLIILHEILFPWFKH